MLIDFAAMGMTIPMEPMRPQNRGVAGNRAIYGKKLTC